MGSLTLPCSALLERTSSLRPPYLWLPGRFGHCETPEKDRQSERGVVEHSDSVFCSPWHLCRQPCPH